MDRIKSFVFDEHAFINHEIGSISTIMHNLCIADRNRIFNLDIQFGAGQVHRSGHADIRTPAIPAQAPR